MLNRYFDPLSCDFLLRVERKIKFHSVTSLSTENLFFRPKHFSFTQKLLLACSSAYIKIKTLGKCSNLLPFHAFIHFRPRFWGFLNFCEIVGLGVDYLMLYDHAWHSFSIIAMFPAYRFVLDY